MMPLSMVLFYFIIILFLYYTFKNKKPLKWNWMDIFNTMTFNQHMRNANDDALLNIPGPIRLPFIGTKWNVLFTKMNRLHEFYEEINDKYGDIVMEMAGNVPVISLFNRHDIEKVLKYPSKFPFRPPTEISAYYRKKRPDRYYSVGLVNAQGQEWAFLRSKLTPKTLESRKTLAAFCPDLNDICDDFIHVIKERRDANNNVVENFNDIMNHFSLEASCCLILGRRMGYLSDETDVGNGENFHELADAVKNVFKAYRDAYYGNGLWKYFPTQTYKDYVTNEETIYRIISKIINLSITESDQLANDNENASVLMTILRTDGLDVRDKISGVIDFLTAGIEVLSHTVSFLLYFLTMHPDAQEKIYQETSEMNEKLTNEDVSKAYYTKAAIHEAFRICPSAFAVARILEEDFVLSGHHVPAGNIVLCHNMIACNKNSNFEDATEYKPERWLDENGEMNPNRGLGSSIVLPFGSGKRICPGKKYSELELIILVIKLVRNFKIKYDSPFERQFEFLLAPKGPINIQFCDRI